MSLETVNFWLGVGTIALQIVCVALLALFLLRKRIPDLESNVAFIGKWGIWIALIVSLGASAVTLIHEQLFGLPPCALCYWQRIFLYPQIILFALALWKRERAIVDYSIALSVIGLGVAIYHHALQMLPAGTIPCPSEGVSCAQIFFLEFGFITYPLMAATLFAFLIVVMLFQRNRATSH